MSDPSEGPISYCLCIDVTDDLGVTRVVPGGEIDLHNADMLREALLRQLGPLKPVVLDMSGVSSIDSPGLRVLLEADAAARARGGSLVISSTVPLVERVLKMAGLWDHLPIVRGRSAATGTEARRMRPAVSDGGEPAGAGIREWSPISFTESEARR